MNLLTVSNTKTLRGEGKGYLTGILHLAPADTSGQDVCPWRSPGCTAGCLTYAGHGGISKGRATMLAPGGFEIPDNAVQRARLARTEAFFKRREWFVEQLTVEIQRLDRAAERKGAALAIRLNGTSDIPWERVAPYLFSVFPHVRFYDYTKSLTRVLAWAGGKLPVNYHLTFSRSEQNADEVCGKAYDAGVNVAVVYAARPMLVANTPAYYSPDTPSIDGDADDLRFLDPHGIVALKAKGRALRDATGFVYRG